MYNRYDSFGFDYYYASTDTLKVNWKNIYKIMK